MTLRVLMIVTAATLAGCRVGGHASETDELREKIVELERALDRATAERDEARGALAQAERVRQAGAHDLPAEVLAAMPRCVGITLDRFTGLDRKGSAVEIYVKPFDGRQRFVQVVGRLTVRADLIPPPPASSDNAPTPPVSLGSLTLGPSQLREAYRSSPLGTHYAAPIPIDPASLADAPVGGSIAVTAELLDALTGQSHEARSIVPLAR